MIDQIHMVDQRMIWKIEVVALGAASPFDTSVSKTCAHATSMNALPFGKPPKPA
jgi:hypothetical protein